MTDITATLKEADELLGSLYRMWPIGVPRRPNYGDGGGESAEDLYKRVLATSELDPALEHRAQLGLGWFNSILSNWHPELAQKAYNHFQRAYELNRQDKETIYLFSSTCHYLKKDAKAPFRPEEPEFIALKKMVEQQIKERWLTA